MPDSLPVAIGTPMTHLSLVRSPDDLKKLTIAELQGVADECRKEVINLVSSNSRFGPYTLNSLVFKI